MDPRVQLRVQRYGWDAAADIYQDAWDRHLAPARARLIEALAPAPGQTILDIAAGTGLLTFEMAQQIGRDGHVLATDLSGEMVRIGAAEAARRELPNVRFERANAESLPAADSGCDAAACAFGLMYMPDPEQALREMRRVLRPGGRAAVAIWGARRNCGWAEVFPIVDARVASEVCPMFFGQGTPGVLEQDMVRAGFTDYAEQRMQTTLDFGSEAVAIHAVIDGGAVAMAAKRFDSATRAEVDAEFLDSLRPYRIGAGFRVPAEFVIASATA